MRWLLASAVVHLALLLVLVSGHERVVAHATLTTQHVEEPAPMVVEMIEPADGGGGHAPAGNAGSPDHAAPTTDFVRVASTRAAHAAPTRARASDPWKSLSVRTEDAGTGMGTGTGTGDGTGEGTGNGIGFGNGGVVNVERDVPAPPAPPPPPVSKARKAKLIWPSRDLDVEDESALFIAKVTVDTDGSVVGARMVTNRPGSRADHAANAIWTFRYEPALDDHGVPVRSTFEQQFQVR